MSVTLAFVRFVQVQQLNGDVSHSSYVYESLCGDDLPPDLLCYHFFEIGTVGWAGGSRFRVKRIAVARALAYANRLHAGGWIDDDNYDRLYGSIEALCYKHRSLIGNQWIGNSSSCFRLER